MGFLCVGGRDAVRGPAPHLPERNSYGACEIATHHFKAAPAPQDIKREP